MKVRDVEQIKESPQCYLERKNYSQYIEAPCLKACLFLYDLNICPYSSGCNKVNYSDAHVMICYDSLSDENKAIAEELIRKGLVEATEYHYEKYLTIAIPTSLDDDVEEISNRLLEIAKNFTYQDVLYGYEVLDDDYIKKYFVNRYCLDQYYDLTDMEVIKTLIIEFQDGYYDEEENLVWGNEELYQKHKAYLESRKKEGSK